MLINNRAQRGFSPLFLATDLLTINVFARNMVPASYHQDISLQLQIKLLQKHNGIFRMEDWKKAFDSLSWSHLATYSMQPD